MSKIFTIFAVLKELISLIKMLLNMVERSRKLKEIQRNTQLQKAIEDLGRAKTDKEIFDAQKRIVDNSN